MKAKDIILLVGALGGLFTGLFRLWEKPYQIESRVAMVETKFNDQTLKYVPMIESTDRRVTILEQNTQEVMRMLNRIEKKLDR